MNKQITISVVIPSYNSSKTIGYTIDHLLKQTVADQVIEIIVVDSSDDGVTKQMLEKHAIGKVRMITSGVRVMPAIQRNIGAKNAQGDILCFIDSDAYPADDWVEQVLKAYSAGIRVGGGSYRVPELQRNNKLAYAQYYLEFNEYIDTGKRRIKRMVPTCNMFCERALFNAVGGIPEIRASEDVLFGLKVGKLEKMTFIPEAKVYHIFRESVDHYLSNQMLIGKYIYVCRRYYSNPFYLNRAYIPVLYPAFMFIKFMRIMSRVVLAGPIHWKQFLWSAPLFFKGLRYWGKGFVQGSSEYQVLASNLTM